MDKTFAVLRGLTQRKRLQKKNDNDESLDMLKADLIRAADLTLRLTDPGLQFAIFCHAGFHGNKFVLYFEGYLIDQKTKRKKLRSRVF